MANYLGLYLRLTSSALCLHGFLVEGHIYIQKWILHLICKPRDSMGSVQTTLGHTNLNVTLLQAKGPANYEFLFILPNDHTHALLPLYVHAWAQYRKDRKHTLSASSGMY